VINVINHFDHIYHPSQKNLKQRGVHMNMGGKFTKLGLWVVLLGVFYIGHYLPVGLAKATIELFLWSWIFIPTGIYLFGWFLKTPYYQRNKTKLIVMAIIWTIGIICYAVLSIVRQKLILNSVPFMLLLWPAAYIGLGYYINQQKPLYR
jgi:hypothetical protein